MLSIRQTLARWAAATVLLVSITPISVFASDCSCSCQSRHRWHGHSDCSSGLREANHGLIHYPGATYWSSWAAPSPWAYRSIAPYSYHYHFFYGDSYGWDGCFDCHN